MLINPKDCDHQVTSKTATDKTVCLKCMVCLEDLKKDDTIHINATEGIKTSEKIG